MKKIFDMKQKRAELTASIRSVMDEFENKEMPGEKKEELAKLEAKFDDLNTRITAEEKQLERERLAGEVADKAEPHKRAAVQEMFAKALSGDPRHMQEYQNALSLGTDATAGNLTAPMEFVQELIKGLDDAIVMRQISRVVGPIGPAQSLGYPYRATEADDATWVSENAESVEETSLTYGRREFKPNRMSKIIKVSKTLVSHAPIAENTVREEMVYRIAAGGENAYMTGNGTGQPLGVFTASNDGIPTSRDVSDGNTATAVTFDGLMNAKYFVKQQYRRNAAWMMHRDMFKMLAKIKDTDGQYIWQPSVALNTPDTLLGHPAYESEFAPNTFAAEKYVAVYGDFKSGYWICDADGMNIQVLDQLYATTNQIGYLFDYFGDGAPVLGEAFARVKLAAASAG